MYKSRRKNLLDTSVALIQALTPSPEQGAPLKYYCVLRTTTE